MSDLTATGCGCNSVNNGCGCNSFIWIIILLFCCGGCGNGMMGRGDDNCGCGCDSIIWIIILLFCCNNNGCGC